MTSDLPTGIPLKYEVLREVVKDYPANLSSSRVAFP